MSQARTPELYRKRLLALLASAALVMPFTPAAAVGDFQLPPSSGTPAPQGPVAPGVPLPRAPSPAPSPTPTPAPAPRPTPTPTVAPAAATPAPAATAPAAVRPTPGASPAATPTTAPTPATTAEPLPSASEPLDTAPQTDLPVAPTTSATPAPEPATSATSLPGWWPWAAGAVALLAALAGAAFLWVRRRSHAEVPVIERPTIERPKVDRSTTLPEPFPAAAPPPPPAPAVPAAAPTAAPADESASETLSIAIEARELTISLSAATLSYRLTLTNNGSVPLSEIVIAGDMISAHASLSAEDQLATPDSPLLPAHRIDGMKGGETLQVSGEFRLPFQSIRAITKGKAMIFVPLARLRVEAAEGAGALIRTALIGQRAATPGAGLQPFRLDLGPRIYREVTQKIF